MIDTVLGNCMEVECVNCDLFRDGCQIEEFITFYKNASSDERKEYASNHYCLVNCEYCTDCIYWNNDVEINECMLRKELLY